MFKVFFIIHKEKLSDIQILTVHRICEKINSLALVELSIDVKFSVSMTFEIFMILPRVISATR